MFQLFVDFGDWERDPEEWEEKGRVVKLGLSFHALECLEVVFLVCFFPQAKSPVAVREARVS